MGVVAIVDCLEDIVAGEGIVDSEGEDRFAVVAVGFYADEGRELGVGDVFAGGDEERLTDGSAESIGC